MFKDFKKSDIPNQEKLQEAIDETVDSIYYSLQARNGRSREQIQTVVEQGIVAEQYLIQLEGFENATGIYNDVKKDGTYYEVKAFRPHRLTYKTLLDLANKLKSWRKKPRMKYMSSQLLIFKFDHGIYSYHTQIDL